jgi:DNA uptake protein ComE-like DNA-binding protein
MGGTNSCLPPSIDPFHTLRLRHLLTKKKHNQTESTPPINTNNNSTIKLNHASEDELMMLPGITRSIAQNILQYRQLRQGFRQIDELLLINGINRDLFERIQSDISIDVPSQSSTKQNLINLNLATYEQLCSIPNLSSILAKRIIERRKRKGPFRFIEDLLNIRGIDYIILANIRSYITVDYHQITLSASQSSIPNLYPTLNKNNNNNHTITSDSLSLASLLLETLPPELQTILLSSPPQRPSPIAKTKQTYIRFASWNLQQLTNEKVQNPGVREVICRIILENK